MRKRTLKIGVIGAGGIASRRTIPSLRGSKVCKVVAVMDPVGAEEIARRFGIPKAYESEEELLADPEVEAVYIASPVQHHARQIEWCALAGKDILCEKPLCRNVAEAERAIAACKRARVLLQEGYMMKFHGAHRRVKELIDDGALGKLVYLRAQLSCWYPKIEGAWRQDPRLGGGGALLDMATHLYDLLEHFAGPVRWVMARVGNLVHSYRSEDASTTLLEFRSGAHATVDCFYSIPDEASRTRLEVYGSAGAVLSEGTIGQGSRGKLEGIFGLGEAAYDALQSKDVARRFRRIPYKAVDPYRAEFEHFAECVFRGKESPLNGPANALRVLRIAEAAYASARSGKAVRLDARGG